MIVRSGLTQDPVSYLLRNTPTSVVSFTSELHSIHCGFNSKEGQGTRGRNSKKGEKKPETAAAAEATGNEDEIFAFACTSDYADVANSLHIPASKCGAVLDSRASCHFCSDKSKFINFKAICKLITAADGCTFKVLGTGDVKIKLPNGKGKTSVILKRAVYAPTMSFTLISVGCIDASGGGVMFKGNMCTIMDPNNN